MELNHQTTEVLVRFIRVLTPTLLHYFRLRPLTLEGKTPPVYFPLTIHFQLTQPKHNKTPYLSTLQTPGRKSDFLQGHKLNGLFPCSHSTSCCVCGTPTIRYSRGWSCPLWITVISSNNNCTTPHWTGWRSVFLTTTGQLAGHGSVFARRCSQGIVESRH